MFPLEGEGSSQPKSNPLQTGEGEFWQEPEVQSCPTWEELVVAEQLLLASNFSDTFCFSFTPEEFDYAKKKIGFAIFGAPDDHLSAIGYSKDKEDTVKRLFEVILAKNKTLLFQHKRLYFSFIFVYLRVECSGLVSVPVFKIPATMDPQDGFACYIDIECRIYSNWDEYLSDNKLPGCLLCFPRNGEYQINSNSQDIELALSNKSGSRHQVLETLDKLGLVGTLGATVVGLATLSTLPVSGPLLVASAAVGSAAGVYGAGRSLATLVDRSKHEQSIDLKNRECLPSYLSLAGSLMGFASSSFVCKMAPLLHHNASLQSLSLLVNGAIIGNTCYHLYEKFKRGEEISALECFQLSAAILFFTNAVVSQTTSEQIAKDKHFSHYEDIMPNKESTKYTNLTQPPHNPKKLVKNLSYFNTKDEFFSFLITTALIITSKIVGSFLNKKLTPEQLKELNEIRCKINNNKFFKFLVNVATTISDNDNKVFMDFIKYLYQYITELIKDLKSKENKNKSKDHFYQKITDFLSKEENLEKIKKTFFELFGN